ncbi:IclR family transcriptional regulator [Falsiroseomonas sp. HW251]|uniref:IclR family transcriptional regulator n=1 Tax=Falsiroseomonas sp. HW251 TaxID=3390998 RepID=UPI003D30F6BC
MYSDRIPPESEGGVRPLSSALKVLALLDRIAARRGGVRPSAIAAELGEGRATVYQRLLTLVVAGWVEPVEDGRYRLTLRAARIARAAAEQAGLGDRAMHLLEALVAETQETASLAVLEGIEPCIVQRVEPAGILRAELRVGASLSLSGSASGRVLVAFADGATLERLRAAKADLPSRAVIEEVRRTGLAVSSGYMILGIRAAAVPVLDETGRCVAALSLVGPETRLDPDAWVAPLKRAAARLSAMLEGR